ncbi:hypothetical protein [Chondromyces apiculatus]|uniref:Uncharacterized protein n=1 Tax=Chondromyces apiculatus DSM 436 TaxID=1192034 RepID=A0A017T8A3_9BACT|nr:hypothetical protein [Chondromyces apiculatus]EYF05025.1 Hypothetical protein CAP_3615 [Chondromyces apiculatus DSM 436]
MYDFPCDWKSGFLMDPVKKQRVGYLVNFQGLDLGEYLKQDIEVFCPYNADASYKGITAPADGGGSGMKKVTVVGVIDSFSWGGGVGDPISISAYISAENAQQLQVKQQTTLKNTKVTKLSWWLVNFDEETKAWFEEAYPMNPQEVAGQLNAPGKTDIRLSIASEAVKVAPNIDVNVYNVFFEIVPAANSTYDLRFATSASKQFVKGWGLKVGTLAEASMK